MAKEGDKPLLTDFWISIDVRRGEGEQQKRLLELGEDGSHSLLQFLSIQAGEADILRRVVHLLQDGGIFSSNLNESAESVNLVKDGGLIRIIQIKVRTAAGNAADLPLFWKWVSRTAILEMLGLQQSQASPIFERIVTRSYSAKGGGGKGRNSNDTYDA